MEDYIKYLKFVIPDAADSKEAYSSFELILLNMQGVQKVTKSGNIVCVYYNSYVYTKNQIVSIMKEKGYIQAVSAQDKKGLFSKWIDKLAKTNKANFGNGRLECCDLND
ncbi:MAG: hypothetical protein L3J35_01355 [Bacteroidales bacterium]|nr:hypothetical protein [Bacteroidales bacterium]